MCENPRIYVIDDFMPAGECEALIAAGQPWLENSGIAFGGKDAVQNVRTSSTVQLNPSRAEVRALHERVGMLLRKPMQHMEDPQVSRYRRGEYYLSHFDGPGKEESGWREFNLCGGQRLATVLVYLNNVSRGGATRFPGLNLEVRPKQGRALVFFPGREDGSIDQSLAHEACEAIDTKWVSQVWVRHGADRYGAFMNTDSSK